MRRALLILIIAAVVLGAGTAWWQFGVHSKGNGTVIRGSGMIEVTQVDVAFEVGGRIVERAVDEGYMVDKGEPVARLDEREYRLQVDRATAAKAAAEARYRLVVRGSRAQEVDQSLAALEAADSERTLRRVENRRMAALRDRGIVSQAELDQSQAALAAAEAAYEQARLRVDVLKEGFRTEEIEEARAQMRETEKALELAELQLTRCQLYAPLAGRVLTKSREVGEIAQPGTPIVTIGDLTRPWLNIYVGERDLGRVALGMPAEVTVDSFADRPFKGRVSFVSERSEFTPKNIQTQDERVKLVYRVKIELENREQQLKPGMPADAVLHLDGTQEAMSTER